MGVMRVKRSELRRMIEEAMGQPWSADAAMDLSPRSATAEEAVNYLLDIIERIEPASETYHRAETWVDEWLAAQSADEPDAE